MYTNELGEQMLKVQVENNGTATTGDNIQYLTYSRYDKAGNLIDTVNSSALKGYSNNGYYSDADLVDWGTDKYINLTSGLIDETTDGPTTTATTSVAGNVVGYTWYTAEQKGQLGNEKSATISHSSSSGTATVTVSGGHGYSNGDIVELSGATSTYAVFNGSYIISNVTSTTFDISVATSTPAASSVSLNSNKPIIQAVNQYIAHTFTSGPTVYELASTTTYDNTDQTGGHTTTYSYTWYSGTNRIKTETITYPSVSASHHGSGSSTQTITYYDMNGRPVWTKDQAGVISYTEYDPATGAVVKQIEDVKYSSLTTDEKTSFDDTGWTEPTSGLNLTTSYVVDDQGRVTQETDPNDNVTYTVYDDVNHETRIYRGWNATTYTTTGPIEILRTYQPDPGETDPDKQIAFTEDITIDAAPNLNGSNEPDGTEAITDSNIVSLTRNLTNDAGQVIETDAYFSFGGSFSYDPQTARLGTKSNDSSSGNYHATYTDYDGGGRIKRVESPSGTITRTVYDVRGLQLSTWVGTDDIPVSGYWSPSNTAGTNLVKVSDNQYDYGLPGDGNLTMTTQDPGAGAAAQVTTMWYDWRDRLVLQKQGAQSSEDSTTHRPITYYDYDNQNRQISVEQYDGDGVIPLGSIDSVPVLENGDFEATGMSGWDTDNGTLPAFGVDNSSSTPYGMQSLTIKDDSGLDENSAAATQTIGNLEPGTYTISVYAKVCNDENLATHFYVQVDGVNQGTPFSRDGTDAGISTLPFTITTGGVHTIGIEADYDTLTTFVQIDHVQLSSSNIQVDADQDGVPDRPNDTLLASESTESYDELGQVYETKQYNINGDTSPGSLKTDYWYDSRGNVIKIRQPGGLVTKTVYDNAGRASKVYQTDGGGDVDSVYGDASSVSGDTVLQQTENRYDADGNVIFTVTKQRAHNSTTTGELPGAAADPNAPRVVGRYLFYNDSHMDGNDSTAGSSDDDAIASNISALLPGGDAATGGHDSGYSKGINGIMIDVQNLPGGTSSLSSSDFTFKVGNNNTISGWSSATNPASITIRRGAGVNGSDRVEIIWANNAISNDWLQVTMKADTLTGLAAPDVFYFGNVRGDSNADGVVDSSDFYSFEEEVNDEVHMSVDGSDLQYSDSFDLTEGTISADWSTSNEADVAGAWLIGSDEDVDYYDSTFVPPEDAVELPLDNASVGAGSYKFALGEDTGGETATLDATITGDNADYKGSVDNGPVDYDFDVDGNSDATDYGIYNDDYGATLANIQPQVQDRTTYMEYYYDAANRLTDSVNLGTNSGVPMVDPDSTVPSRSDTALVTSYTYDNNDSGARYSTTTDPAAVVSRTYTDGLGRTTETIADYDDGTPSTDNDQTTAYSYDGNGDVLTMTAVLPSSTFQTTQYVYGSEQPVTITHSSTTATVTLNGHGYKVGQSVTISGANSISGTNYYNGTFTITAVTTNTFSYTMSANPGANATVPSGDYIWARPASPDAQSISSGHLTSSSGVATVNLTSHGYIVGDQITISGADQPEYNGTFIITDVPDSSHFKFAIASSAAATATGTISVAYSGLADSDLQTAIRYPDKSSGSASTSEQELYTVDSLGEHKTYTDRNGSTHTYTVSVRPTPPLIL